MVLRHAGAGGRGPGGSSSSHDSAVAAAAEENLTNSAGCHRKMAAPSGAGKNLARVGEQAFQKMDKINAEVFTLTYGSMVQVLLKDYEEVNEVNTQLEKM